MGRFQDAKLMKRKYYLKNIQKSSNHTSTNNFVGNVNI